MTDRAGGKVVVELLELLFRGVVRTAVLARVEDDEPAVFEVVNPALGHDLVVGPIHLPDRADRPQTGGGVVVARRGRAIRIALEGPRRNVCVAHVRLGLTEHRSR